MSSNQRRSWVAPLMILGVGFLIWIISSFLVSEATCIPIGFSAPLSGEVSHLGLDCRNGLLLAIEEVNEDLYLQGKSERFCLVAYDDEDKTRQAIVAAYRLIDRQVKVVFAHLSSGLTLATSPLYHAQGIVQLAPSSHMHYTSQGYDTAYRIMANDLQQSSAIARFIVENLDSQRVAILHNGTTYGEELSIRVANHLYSDNRTVVSHEFVQTNETDFRVLISKIMRLNPDTIFYAGVDSQLALFAKQLRELGIEIPLVSGDMACNQQFIHLAGEASSMMYCATNGRYPSDTPEGLVYTEKYRARFGSDPLLYSSYYYDAAKMITALFLENPEVDLRLALLDIDYSGISSRFTYEGGDLGEVSVGIYSPVDGQLSLQTIYYISSFSEETR